MKLRLSQKREGKKTGLLPEKVGCVGVLFWEGEAPHTPRSRLGEHHGGKGGDLPAKERSAG